jgi:hypothetical protein
MTQEKPRSFAWCCNLPDPSRPAVGTVNLAWQGLAEMLADAPGGQAGFHLRPASCG